MDAAVQVKTTVKRRKKVKISTIVIYAILILWAVLTVFPFVWVVMNSFKPSAEVLRSSFALPNPVTMMNYENAFGKLNVLNAYGHSFLISGSVTVGVMVFASLMSFGLTRYHFKGKQLVRSLIVASLMFPVFATIIPVFRMIVEWGLLNKNIAVILPQIAGNLSFATIVMTGFMQSIRWKWRRQPTWKEQMYFRCLAELLFHSAAHLLQPWQSLVSCGPTMICLYKRL